MGKWFEEVMNKDAVLEKRVLEVGPEIESADARSDTLKQVKPFFARIKGPLAVYLLSCLHHRHSAPSEEIGKDTEEENRRSTQVYCGINAKPFCVKPRS